ncbi:uncharacterized protein ppp1r3aa [Cottoperca gobio]|uniref:Uncharacterized protein ppp1r3aa n=1 Tax=Cottoperca gobio TaxID=56716 RepID=A0A6J2S5T9_COTGO|nr:protein phosphatase 1 regulatory subunit 3A [Cottoperca gobio]
MEALHIQPLEKNGAVKEEDSKRNGEQKEASDEQTDEDSEPESPQVILRKVSFADAFGFNLVSVKEFDIAEVAESKVSQPPENEAMHPSEEFYMSCLFTVPSSPEALEQRLRVQMVELESIELLPGTTTLRGNVRVVNLCYSKSVYARMTLDRWTSYFDLLAEYVPGSSDRKTDRFTFMYTLVPPFEREGTRVEICLRYDTSVGTFWANNTEMNYVLFCHQKGRVKEHGPQVQEESIGYKRSCLKANTRGSAEEKINTPAAAEATHKAEEANRKHSTDIQSLLSHEGHKPLVNSINSRHRAAHLARVQDYFSRRRQQVPKAYSHDSANRQKVSVLTPWGESASFLHKRHKKQSNEMPQVLTYHQIPLLTLDWNTDKAHQWGAADMDDICTGKAKMTLSKASEENLENKPTVNDMWETFPNGTDDTPDKETSVCNVWQAFLNGPSCTDHSAVPESEWLQTAASVSPSNDKEHNAQTAASSQEHEFEVGADTPTTLHTHSSAVCQLLSDTCQKSLYHQANAALNTEDHQPAEACVCSLRDDNTETQDASQRSQTNAVTDTPQEFCLKGATQVSEGSVDSSTECQEHAMWKRGRQGKLGRAEGIGQDEPFTPYKADLITSSGESDTTDMTAMPESQNATAVDRISQGARVDEGLSSGREGEVTGTSHSVMDDTLAFRGTIGEVTKDGEWFVFSTSRQGVEEGIVNNCTENKVSTDEERFRPRKTAECEISPWCADEKQHEEFRQEQNSENLLQENENEITLEQRNADESNPSQTSEQSFKRSQIMASEFKLDEAESEDVASNSNDLEVFKKAEMEPSYCTTRDETKRLIGAEVGIVQVLNEEINDEAFQFNSSWRRGNTSIIPEMYEQSKPIKAGEEVCIQKEEEDSTLTQIKENVLNSGTGEYVLVSYQGEEGKSLSCDGIIEEQQEITRHTVESREMKKVFQGVHDAFRPFPTDACNSNPVEEVEMRWSHSQDDMKGQKEDVGPEEVAKEDTLTELQQQPETLERREEDMSQRDKDESMSVGKLEIEVLGELMGNGENPQGERKNAPAELKEQELSAEVECSSHVECKKLSEGTKDPITAHNTVALEVIGSGLEMFIERFGEDLISGIWEEVFGRKERASNKDADIVDGMGGKLVVIPDITQDRLFETDFSDAFDSGVFSLTELPTDTNSSLCQGLEQTLERKEYAPEESRSHSKTHSLSESQMDSNSSAHLSQDLTPILTSQSRQSWPESAQRAPQDQENYTQIKERSVTRQETGRQIEDCVVARRESFNLAAHPSRKHQSSSCEKLKESDGVVMWSVSYILRHITRLLIGALLVSGLFFIVFLCDFPAFFALYTFSLVGGFISGKDSE